MSRNEASILKCINAMCTKDGHFETKGKTRVLSHVLPHDKDTSQFVVGGHPVFTISFAPPIATFTVYGFAYGGLSKEEYKLSADATNLMFRLLEIDASAKPRDDRMDISSQDEMFLSYGAIKTDFDIKHFYEKLQLLSENAADEQPQKPQRRRP